MAIKLSGNDLGSAGVASLINVAQNRVVIPGALEMSGVLNLNNDLNITGNINIAGALNYTETNKTETNLFIEDKTIMVGSGSSSASDASGAGLLIGSGSHGEGYASFLYDDSLNSNAGGFDFNVDNATVGSISAAGLDVLGDVTITGNDLNFGNGATVVNGDANTLTITEATVAVAGNATVSQDLTVTKDSVLTENVAVGGALNVTGALRVGTTSNLVGDATFGGNILADQSEAKAIFAAVDSHTITVGAAGSTLAAAGNLTVAQDLTVTKDSVLTENVAVGGALDVTGSSKVGGTLRVALGSNLIGDVEFGGHLVADSNENKSIFEDITSQTILMGGANSTVETAGNVRIAKLLFVTGNADFAADVQIDGSATVSTDLTVTKDSVFGENVGVGGALNVTGALRVGTTSNLVGDATFGGNILADQSEAKAIFAAVDSHTITVGAAGSTLAAAGNLTVAQDLTVTKDSVFSENASVQGALAVTGNLDLGASTGGRVSFGTTQGSMIARGVGGAGDTNAAAGLDLTIASFGTIAFTGSVETANGIHINKANAANGAVLQFNNRVSMNAADGCLALTGSGALDDAKATAGATNNVLLRLPSDRALQAGELITYSDVRLKTDITEMDDSQTLDMVMSMNPVSYNLKTGGKRQIGFLAQEMAELYPEVCLLDRETGEGIGIDYSRLTSVLAAALQAQQRQIESLKKAFVTIKK